MTFDLCFFKAISKETGMSNKTLILYNYIAMLLSFFFYINVMHVFLCESLDIDKKNTANGNKS